MPSQVSLKMEAKGNLIETHTEGHGKMEAKTGVMQPQAQERQGSHQTLGKANYRFSPRA